MSASATPGRAELEVVSDVICPWCYIGKHRLARALEMLDEALRPAVRWRPFELNPGLPREGMDRRAYCTAKFGSLEYADQLYANVAAQAHADGLPMAVERIARTPNTRAAHRLIERAAAAASQDAVVDALFAAYFVDGRDIGDAEVLAAIGGAAGLDTTGLAAALVSGDGDAAIESQEHTAHALGVSGVPAFVYNGHLLFSGAQSPATIARAIERAHARGL